jgi:hypothetical protein
MSFFYTITPTDKKNSASLHPLKMPLTAAAAAAAVARSPAPEKPTEHFFQFTESLRTKLRTFFNSTDVDPNDDLAVIKAVNQNNPSPAVLKALIAIRLVSTFDLNSTPPRFGEPLSSENLNSAKQSFLDGLANHIHTRAKKNLRENIGRQISPKDEQKPTGNAVDTFLQHSDTLAFESIAKELQPYVSTDGAQNISGFLGSLEDLRTARRIAKENPMPFSQGQERTA